MFLVKHIHLSGAEDLYQTPTIRYSTGRGVLTPENTAGVIAGSAVDPATLWISVGMGVEHPLTGGTIFVMNDNGKTVARYDLGASMIPIDASQSELSFAEFSREKDGGLAAEAVDTLRRAPHGRMAAE